MAPLRRTASVGGFGTPRPGHGVELVLDTVLAELADDDPEVRRRAVLAVGELPAAWPVMLERLPIEPDRTVRHAIGTQLARHDLPEIVAGLVPYLSSSDAALRNLAAEVLAQTPRSTVLRVPGLLVDADPDVRQMTVGVVARLRVPEVEEWLTRVVHDDPHPNVVAAAIDELVHVAGHRCDAELRRACARFPDDPFIAFAVAGAIGSAGPGPS